MNRNSVDVTIIGGGMIGSAIALGLAKKNFSVALFESCIPRPTCGETTPGLRVSAISLASVKLLKKLGVWDEIKSERCTAYHRLEAWEFPDNIISFDASQFNEKELGYMIENQRIRFALWQALKEYSSVKLYKGIEIKSFLYKNKTAFLSFSDDSEILTKLVIGADGSNSQVKKIAEIGTHCWRYRQLCMLITVICKKGFEKITWQKFTPTGARGFLPLFDNWASLAWYDNPNYIRHVSTLCMKDLSQEIFKNFPNRLGPVIPTASSVFPLIRSHTFEYIAPGLAILGDAAHTVHPLAGQGANMGFRDVRKLIDTLTDRISRKEEWSSVNNLRRYQRVRILENYLMQFGIDCINTVFSSKNMALLAIRNLGILSVNHSPLLKSLLVHLISKN